jgi:hypothetical protein
MGGVVADQFERARVLAREEFDPGVGADRIGEVAHLAIQHHRDRTLRERGRDALGHVVTGNIGGKLPTRAVGEGQRDHSSLLLAHSCERAQVSA